MILYVRAQRTEQTCPPRGPNIAVHSAHYAKALAPDSARANLELIASSGQPRCWKGGSFRPICSVCPGVVMLCRCFVSKPSNIKARRWRPALDFFHASFSRSSISLLIDCSSQVNAYSLYILVLAWLRDCLVLRPVANACIPIITTSHYKCHSIVSPHQVVPDL